MHKKSRTAVKWLVHQLTNCRNSHVQHPHPPSLSSKSNPSSWCFMKKKIFFSPSFPYKSIKCYRIKKWDLFITFKWTIQLSLHPNSFQKGKGYIYKGKRESGRALDMTGARERINIILSQFPFKGTDYFIRFMWEIVEKVPWRFVTTERVINAICCGTPFTYTSFSR